MNFKMLSNLRTSLVYRSFIMSWQFQGISGFIVLCLSCLLFELMTFINQRLERDPKCGALQLTTQGLKLPTSNERPGWYGRHLTALMLQLSSKRQSLLFLQEAGILPPSANQVSSPRLETEVHRQWWLCDSGHAGCAGSSIEGQEAQAAPGVQAMTHSRKEARARWAKTEPKMLMRRLARLYMSWKATMHFIIQIKPLRHSTKIKR